MECIVISKKFFLSHCTEAMKRRLLLEVSSELDNWTLSVTALHQGTGFLPEDLVLHFLQPFLVRS